VLCEKPIAMNVAEATRMIEAADRNGVRLYVAENAAYVPMAKSLREMVRTGRSIGELTAASVIKGFRAPRYGYPGRRAWLSTPDQGGLGTWLLHGIHSMGQLRYILGEVRMVYVQEHKGSSFERKDLEGTMSGLLTLESGVHVSIVQTAETKLYGDLGGYVLHGDRGSVRAGEEVYRIFADDQDGTELRYPEEALSSYAQEIEAFADYVTDGIEGPTTGVMERRSLAIVQAGYESAESGQPIDLDERFGLL
jgi:predicted dehydrogenase